MKISRRTVEEDIWAFRFFAAKLGLAGGVPEDTANWLMVPTKLLVIFKFVVGQSQRSSLLMFAGGTCKKSDHCAITKKTEVDKKRVLHEQRHLVPEWHHVCHFTYTDQLCLTYPI